MSPDREPISPPASPSPHEEEELDNGDISDSNCEDSYAPADGTEGKDYDSDAAGENDDDDDDDDDDDNENNDSDVPSSPPTSVETGSKSDQRTVSGEISTDGYRAPAVETDDDEDNDDETRHGQREYFQNHYETGNDTFATHRKNWENSSQWEDEEGETSHLPPSSPPMAHVQSQSSSRKSPSSPMFPPRPRQTNSAKSNLNHQFSSRRSPASRASSGSYDPRELHRDEKKPPLVLLHVTLLLLPGAEEVVLRHLTPTTLERGVLVEHPRGDYNLLEELILDGLGIDDDFVEETTEPEEPQEKTWEQALNISPSPPQKKAWQLRVYASNGLMTPGAWKRVWAEMERIDVEIWPRGYDRKIRSNRSSSLGGGHSRGTSTSSVFPYQSDEGVVDDLDYTLSRDDGRRKSLIGATVIRRSSSSNSGQLNRLASPAPVPNSPGRARTPTTTSKSRRGRSRTSSTSATMFNFDFNKLLTPRAVMIYAGINFVLFTYFTVFRFINLTGAWSSSIAKFSYPFRSSNVDGVQVHEVSDERCPVEVSSESCGGSIEAVIADPVVAENDAIEDEKRVLVNDEEDETVPDPEIEDNDEEAVADEEEEAELDRLEGEFGQDVAGSEDVLRLDLEDGSYENQEQVALVEESENEFNNESTEEIQEQEGGVDAEANTEAAWDMEAETDAEAKTDAETETEIGSVGSGSEPEPELAPESVAVEEKSKHWFPKGFGFS